jgi:transcription elongation factor Elf1
MADDIIRETDEIQATDIVFDCPHCGKSLCIDYRGAGLNIACTDCGEEASVPIPDGMELDDLDSSPQDQEVRIINLRNSLAQSEARARGLAEDLEILMARCAELKAERDSVTEGSPEVLERISRIQQAQADIHSAVDGLAELMGLGAEEEPSDQ